jgi:hypothetical protein
MTPESMKFYDDHTMVSEIDEVIRMRPCNVCGARLVARRVLEPRSLTERLRLGRNDSAGLARLITSHPRTAA